MRINWNTFPSEIGSVMPNGRFSLSQTSMAKLPSDPIGFFGNQGATNVSPAAQSVQRRWPFSGNTPWSQNLKFQSFPNYKFITQPSSLPQTPEIKSNLPSAETRVATSDKSLIQSKLIRSDDKSLRQSERTVPKDIKLMASKIMKELNEKKDN